MTQPSNQNLPFLDRATYRVRRLRDAVRFMPVLGTLLFLLPLLWLRGTMPTSRATIYLFLSWAVMILLAGLLRWALAWAERRSKDGPG